MNSKINIFFIILAIFSCTSLSGQELVEGPMTICPVDPHSHHTRVPLPSRLSHLLHSKDENARRNSRRNFKSNFIVNYTGFTKEARAAFQFAVDIWASLIPSDIEIIVDASFEDLGVGVLGSAGASFLVRDFKNAPSDTTFYPIALAEKIAGKQLNLPGEFEITCRFSSTFDFYFGVDGDPPNDQFDFVSIVLHELGHGLGFAGTENVDMGIGTWDYFNNKTSRYNQFVELGDGTSILDIENSSTALGDALTGGDIFFNGELAIASLGERPELFAPSTYNGGSSFSHLDEIVFPPGDENSLMSPQFGRGESILDPGVALDIFADMGWFITVLDHELNREVIDNLVDDIIVEVELRSDTNIVSNELKVVYSVDNFQTSAEVALAGVGENRYSASIPNPGFETTIKYYFEGIEDGLGRSLRSPNVPGSCYNVLVKEVALVSVPFTLADGDFENGDAGFFTIPLNGETDVWELGTPLNELQVSSSPTNVWKTNLETDIEFNDVSYECALVSPYFDLKDSIANYILSFELGMELFTNEDGGVFDSGPIGANVEFSTNGGASWEILGSVDDQSSENWYNFQNNGGGTFSTNVFDNEPGWIIDSINTVKVEYNISQLSDNDSVAFRVVFHVESDFITEGYQTDGILIDNFKIDKEDPSADFIVNSEGNIFFPGQTISFEHISRGATSYEWDFGDGSISTSKNPDHVYETGGVFDVSLTVQYEGGSDQVVKEGLLTVVSRGGSSITLEEGGNFEIDNGIFLIENISGTGFERGNSSIEGKNGTASGDIAIVTGLQDDNYLDGSEAFLFTPLFDFSSLGNYQLSFEANYQTEDGWDGFIVEYSLDNGDSWSQLEPVVQTGWYDRIGEDNPEQGWPAIPLFTGTTDGNFVTKTIDVSDFNGSGDVGFRFHWLSDRASTDVGVAIDDFVLKGPVPGPAIANFVASNDAGCIGQEVVFENTSTGTINSLIWNFGAGASPSDTTGIGPFTVTYLEAGQSTVTLTASGPDGDDVETKIIAVSELFEPKVTFAENDDNTVTLTSPLGESYQWVRDEVLIEGANERSLVVDDPSEYYVIVTIGGCEQSSEPVQYIVLDVEDEIGEISIWPNPIQNELNVSLNNGLRLEQIILYNLSGARVMSLESNSAETVNLDIPSLESGIYLLEVKTSTKTITEKIIID